MFAWLLDSRFDYKSLILDWLMQFLNTSLVSSSNNYLEY